MAYSRAVRFFVPEKCEKELDCFLDFMEEQFNDQFKNVRRYSMEPAILDDGKWPDEEMD
jgi:hypothetical protein